MIKVFVSNIQHSVVYSTDFEYVKNFGNFLKNYGIEAHYPKGISWHWKENLYTIINKVFSVLRISYRIKFSYNKKRFPREYFNDIYDIVYVHEMCPDNISQNTPVFLETTSWKSGQNDKPSSTEDKRFYDRVLPLMKYNLSRNCVINLKSETEKNNILEFFPEAGDRIVNLPFLLPHIQALPWEDIYAKHSRDSVLKVLFVGTQAQRKGLPALLSAYKRLYESLESPNIELHIVSGYSDGSVSVPTECNIIEHGRLPIQETMALFKQCHFFAMVSQHESYGLVYIEAMAYGCVNMARDFFPQKEILDYGESGILVDPYSEDAIYGGLVKLYNMSREERICVAKKAHLKFLNEYDYRVVAPRYKDLFESMVKK